MVTSFNHTTTFGNGVTVNYRTRAMNGVGYGPYSSIFTWVTDSVPLFMNPPVIATSDILYNQITITWTAITLPA